MIDATASRAPQISLRCPSYDNRVRSVWLIVWLPNVDGVPIVWK